MALIMPEISEIIEIKPLTRVRIFLGYYWLISDKIAVPEE
jgi:hypothetical protein